MQSRHRFAQRCALLPAALGVAAALCVQVNARAQDYAPGAPGVPPGYIQQDPADANVLGDPSALAADPPSRIATVTEMAGGLSFAPAGSDEWAAVGLNRPITTGDRLWVDPGGRAELHAGTTAVRLGGGTAATILNLDDRATQVKLTQGTLQLRVRALPADQQVEVDTPNLAFVPREPGDYRIDVSPDGTSTLVTMRHGSAVLYGDTRSIELARGQRMRFAGTDLADAGQGSYPAPDSFDQWAAARDAREDASPSARYVPPDMTGYTALDDYGDWQQDPGYGAVWFPREVATGWAPYSTGHWAWVAPWGWTWIDDAPWGFAPSHYGRWAYFGSRWGWVPGPVAVRPCYAPAVVGFVGGASIRIGGGPGVAWYPLGPRDVYRPVYRASPRYVTRINNFTVNNNWMRGGDRDRWVNRNVPGAITGMPSRNFVEGRPVPRGSHREEWRNLPAGEARGGPIMGPVKSSLVGGARPQGLPPMARQGFERQAIVAHQPGRVGADDLARRFAREGGTGGAGPAWHGPVPGADDRRQGPPGRDDARRGPQLGQVWQPDVRMSQAAQAGRGQRPDGLRSGVSDAQRQQFDQQRDQQRQLHDQQRQMQDQQRLSTDNQRQQQQALQRQMQDQQRQMQDQQRQSLDQQRRQQFDQQRQAQDQQRQLDEQRRDAMGRQQFDQQRAQQERQQQDIQRQAQDHQRQFDQQRAQQERQQQDVQRQAQERQRQFDQQRAQQERQQQDIQRQQQEVQRQAQMRDQQQRQFQDQQRQQMDQQRQQAAQRQQLEQARQFQEQQRQQFEQQRQQAMQRQQMEQQQRQAQDQQRRMQEQQQQMQQQQMQQQQMQQQQRQAQEQQRQFQEQQRQQQDRQRQFQEQQRQQQQQQQQRVQQDHARHGQQQARNDERR
ncbi:DUF6600 domain-containing protein [Cupriavidus sp.]|uniref:DUF6600 domain-containing protein n=1 Tax=Cupriavidus sp. TaxID=1873897 RepID=UPI0025BA3DE6|nr:DUF6600 domain-containing protein [Cupriavidus sp.]MCA3208455.1 branched-chain amino acid ABC transporter substrate-binding protein [Cupriavidus sp.]